MTNLQAEALTRATSGTSVANYSAIYSGFIAKGIAESDILPRVNVLTFNAWKAKGRSVKKGEHGVRIFTFIECEGRQRDPSDGSEKASTYRRPSSTTVFHISQTEPTADREARRGNKSTAETTAQAWGRRMTERFIDPAPTSTDRWLETK